jgi:hypothetical protein
VEVAVTVAPFPVVPLAVPAQLRCTQSSSRERVVCLDCPNGGPSPARVWMQGRAMDDVSGSRLTPGSCLGVREVVEGVMGVVEVVAGEEEEHSYSGKRKIYIFIYGSI